MATSKISRARWAAIRLFAMDVDGILTDGTVQIHSDGTESKRFSILDGMGLGLVREAGIVTAWISGRASGATRCRAKELRIAHLVEGRRDKLAALCEIASQEGLSLEQCVYMGDDYIDAPAMKAAGIGISVPHAMAAALKAADLITQRTAGLGAVREVCDHLLDAQAPRPHP
jgi:3-deoxy-D-manno-octulosonate 8-phosphate phosphatase (KDO 8-P phosphatase)